MTGPNRDPAQGKAPRPDPVADAVVCLEAQQAAEGGRPAPPS